MRIRVREKGGTNLFVPLPTGLICNRLTALIAARAASEYGVRVSPARLVRLFTALKRYKKQHPDWVLVEVHSADGDYVSVKL